MFSKLSYRIVFKKSPIAGKNYCLLQLLIIWIFLISNTFPQYENIRVDGPQSFLPEEVTITINPINPNIIAAGANIDHFYISTDGGMSWNESHLNSSLGVAGDPCVLFDISGNLYYAHLSNPPSGNGTWLDRIVVQKSTDNGLTWNDGTGIGHNSPKDQDKEWLAVDFSQSPYRGNIYATWTEFDAYGHPSPTCKSRIRFSRSTNQGISWDSAVTISDVSGDCIDSDSTTEGAVPCVGPNGEIYVSWAGPLGLVFDKSTDGGLTWGEDIFVTDMPGGWAFDILGIFRCNGLPITMCDISSSPNRGNIYIVWSDQRNGVNNTDIFLVKSSDGGNTWGMPVKVNDDETSRHQFFVWSTLDQSTGNLWFVFYDRRNTTVAETDVFIAKSINGGESFENFKISESPFKPSGNIFFGDYTNIAAFNGKIHPIWMQLHDNQLSIWTTIIEDVVPVESSDISIIEFALDQNYPNPFNPNTNFEFRIANFGLVSLKVFDVLGNEVATLVNEEKYPGSYKITFDASTLASGIYFYRLQAGNFMDMKKMILIR